MDHPNGDMSDDQETKIGYKKKEKTNYKQTEKTDLKKESKTCFKKEEEEDDDDDDEQTDNSEEESQTQCEEERALFEEDGWTKIGTLRRIYIYPVDTCKGYQLKRAFCSYNGMCSFIADGASKLKTFCDRALVLYWPKTMSAILLDENVADAYTLEDLANIQGEGSKSKNKIKISYFGHEMEVFDTSCAVGIPHGQTYLFSEWLEKYFKLQIDKTENEIDEFGAEEKWKTIYKFGYISLTDRDLFNIKVRPDLDRSALRGIYYPYTLINSKSLDSVAEAYPSHTIYESRFRSQLVIEATEPYIEDRISSMRIGKEVEFGNFLPCTHDFIDLNHSQNTGCQDSLYAILQKKRNLKMVFPQYAKASLPVFGCNMDVVEDGEIMVNDSVYAKFTN